MHVPVEYDIDADPGRIDRDAVWVFLSTEAYWGRWRERAQFEAQLADAWRVVGAYERVGGELVGFARAVSDGIAFAYLADVFVARPARGRGLGRALVSAMIDEGPGATFRWMLHTTDAHGLYSRFGFAPANGTCLERPARGAAAPPDDRDRPSPPDQARPRV